MNKPKVELLSPAGSMETLKAVAVAGADAVYGAGRKFGARAYANNFAEEELLYAMDYLHLHGKRFYLTVNTLLKENELKHELYEYIKPLYLHGLDGVIIQDLGVLKFLREYFPGMELHASTQMSITGPGGAALMKKMGCNRVVTARELSLEEIKEIHDSVDIEIESFVHGALCYCYSGQCLFSSILGGRSGNRGRCAQPCRLPYKTGKGKEQYLLSPKDLCTIELLPQLIENGVYSLKIEGRMKQAEYAAGVTGIYREYLDRYLYNPYDEYKVSQEDLVRLEELGSRSGFTKGYYFQKNGPSMMTMNKPAHTKSNDDLQEIIRQKYIHSQIQEKMKGNLILSKEKKAKLVLEYNGFVVETEGDMVQKAQNRPLEEENVASKMQKTGGSPFCFETLKIQMDKDIFIPIGSLNQLRRDGIQQLQDRILEQFRREKALEYKDMSFKQKIGKEVDTERNVVVSVQTLEQCEWLLKYPYIKRIYIDSNAFTREKEISQLKDLVSKVHQNQKQLFYIMPVIMRMNTRKWYETYFSQLENTGVDGFVVGNYESLELVHNFKKQNIILLADSSLYAWSDNSIIALKEAGVQEFTFPIEANEKELAEIDSHAGEMVIYGYIPLMVSAQCVKKNTTSCTKEAGVLSISDRYHKIFKVRNLCKDCYNMIYNSSPLALFHQKKGLDNIHISKYRIAFTFEKKEQVAEIMSYYEKCFIRNEKQDMEHYLKDFTNGHWKRGVE